MRNISAPAPSLTRRKLYLAMVTATQLMWAGQAHASPEGGNVVGGAGNINQSGKETVIHQQTDRMAIDWQSFNVKADEHVQFIQPGASSIALNRVISNKGSEILGRIDANGQVFLVNPNGVVFGNDSQINVGGILASGLSINPTDFMNGNFTLSEVEGAAGKVVNSGIINAATGGSVTLLGKEVTNDGLIIANLGAVNLAVGKEAVVTFEKNGLVGVKVTKEVLQSELGVDAALINSGEINAEGGRILLTASTSQDIFSQAVNHEGMNATTSVVVNEDGSFTLGGGADVVNTGKLSTSVANGDAGQIVVVGDKVTNSGAISADSQNGNGGHIELNSKHTTILNQTASVSAQSTTIGKGGDVKVLGDKVGLMDTAGVNASGANGGGQVLIGGDETGKNKYINSANFIYLGVNTNVNADGLLNGSGGKLITFAQDTARINGNLSAHGGIESGSGGFIETSGLKGFEILNAPDISAQNGFGGTWLIDPYNITIQAGGGGGGGGEITNPTDDSGDKIFATSGGNAVIKSSTIKTVLESLGTDKKVLIRTTNDLVAGNTTDTSGNILITDDIRYSPNSSKAATLRLEAHNDIKITNGITIDTNTNGILNVELIANNDNSGAGGVIDLGTGTIKTNGGNFTSNSSGFNGKDANIDTSSVGHVGGGVISITSTGAINNVDLGVLKFNYGDTPPSGETQTLSRVGSVEVNSEGSVSLWRDLNFNNTGARNKTSGARFSNVSAGENPELKITAAGDITIGGSIFDLYGDARDALDISLKSTGSAGVVTIYGAIYTSGGNFAAESNSFKSNALIDTDHANDGTLTDFGNLTSPNATWSNGGNIIINASQSVDLLQIITDRSATGNQGSVQGKLQIGKRNASDNLEVKQTTSSVLNVFGTTTFDLFSNNAGNNAASAINLTNAGNIFTGNILFTSAGNVNIRNNTDTKLGASDIKGTFGLTSSGNIEDFGVLKIAGILTIGAPSRSVTLDSQNNDFSRINFLGTFTDLIIADANALALGSINTAGKIDITATSGIHLNGNLNAAGGSIELKNNVILNDDIAFDASGSTTRGDISFGGAVTSTSNKTLNLTGKAIVFSGNVGDATTNRIGALTVNATEYFGSNSSFYATSFNLTANSILANVLDSLGGDVTLTGTNAVTVNEISAQGSSTHLAGGNVTIDGADITLGNANNIAVNTVGSGAGLTGDVIIRATEVGTPSITIKGDINSGAKVAALTLVGTGVTAGKVDLGSYSLASGFTSSLLITGSAGTDTIIGNSIENTWDITGAANQTIKKTGTVVAPFITYSNFENLSGGSQADAVNLANSFAGIIDGKAGNDVFNVKIDTALTANLVGGDGTDELNASNDRENVWSLGGASETLNTTLSFSGIENLNGGDLKDTFTITGTRGGVIDAGIVSLDDIVLVNSDMTVDFTQANINGIKNAEIIQNIGGDAIKLTTINTSGTSAWKIWDFDVGNDADGINDGEITFNGTTIKFLDFSSLVGGTGNDTFTFIDAATINGLVDGGGGASNIVNLSGATGNRTIEVGSTVNSTSLTVTGINSITANSATTSTLLVSSAAGNTKTWTISGVDSGLVDGVTFTNFKNLTGGAGADIFDFSPVGNTGSVSGVISGGSGSNTIKGRVGVENTWAMLSNTSGSLGETANLPTEYVNNFANIQNFIGSNTGVNTMDFSAFTGNVKIELGTGVSGASFITSFIGNYVDSAGPTAEIVGANNPTNNWQITGENKGTVGSISFDKFNILTGGTGNDNFVVTSSGSVTGSISGGTNGTDTLTYGGATGISWILDAANSGRMGTTLFSNINSITGSGLDSLTGRDQDNDWNISGPNSGTLRSSASAADQISFAGMSNLIGQSGKDNFTLKSTGSLTGKIDGGTGTEKNKLTSEIAGATWALDKLAALSGKLNLQIFQNIHDIVGSGSDTLVGRNQNNDWQITSANAGTVQLVNSSADLIFFTGVINLTGNALNDSFLIASGASVDGIINGGVGGTNKLTNNTSNATWTLDSTTAYKGTVSGKTFINISEIVGNSGALTGRGQANTWVISGAGSGTVQATDTTVVDKITFGGMNNLNGTAFADDFSIGATGSLAGTLNGGSGTGENSLTGRASASIFAMSGANSGALFDSSSVNPVRYAAFSNVQKITGGSTADTLTGTNSTSTWTFDSVNKLQIDGNTNLIEFAGIETAQGGNGTDVFNINTIVKNVLGGNGDDTFNLASTGKATLIDGERDTNKLVVPQNPSKLESLKSAWILTAANKGTVTHVSDANLVTSFESIQSLVGSEVDSLKGIDQNNRWTISDQNKGALSASNNSNTINFSGIGKLIGGTESDYFDFSADNAAVTIGIDGGDTKAQSNTIRSHVNFTDEWTLTGNNSGSLTIENNSNPYIPIFENIQKREAAGDVTVTGYIDLSTDYDESGEIKGSLTGSPTVVGFNQNSIWNITGPNSGTIVVGTKTIKFSRFANLTGGNQDDLFSFSTGGAISGNVIGGGSNENSNAINTISGINGTANSWQMTALNSGEVKAIDIPDRYAKFQNIQRIIGGSKTDTLYGLVSGDSTTVQNWQLNNNESIFFFTNPNSNIKFSGIENIEGGAGTNTVINTIANHDWVITDANAGNISFGGNKKFGFSKIGKIEGSDSDTLQGMNQDNNWQLSDGGVGSVSKSGATPTDTLNFSGIKKIIGGSGSDAFNVGVLGDIDEIDGGANSMDASDSLVSKERDNDWVIEADGTSKLYVAGNTGNYITFNRISNLTGGAFEDKFYVRNKNQISGLLDGGTGNGFNLLDVTSITTGVTVGVGASAPANVKIANINQLKAQSNPGIRNTLIADDIDGNIFTIIGADSGTLDTISFEGFGNLMGRQYADTFIFKGKNAKISGVIDGSTYFVTDGTSYTDELDLSLFELDANVAMLNGNSPKVGAINILNLEKVTGSTSGTNTFFANDKINTWAITDFNSGSISNESTTKADGTAAPIEFFNFEILVGGIKDDLFEFSQSGKLDGYIDGGAHDKEDVVDLSKQSAVKISLDNLKGYRSIERFIGNKTNSTLIGGNSGDVWNLTGANSGNVNGTVLFADFTDFVGGEGNDTFNLLQTEPNDSIFKSLVGGAGNDVFNLTEGRLLGSVSGGVGNDTFRIEKAIVEQSMDGEIGDDILNAIISELSAETITFRGGDGADSVYVTGSLTNASATHTNAVDKGGLLRYDVKSAAHKISYQNVENVNDKLIVDTLIVNGTDVADVFSLAENSYALNGFTAIKYENKNNLIVAGAVDDKVLISAPVTIPNFLTIKSASVETTGNGEIRANGLALDGVISAGKIDNRLQTNVANLSINTSAGDIYIQEKNGLNISGFDSNNNFDLFLDGNLTSDVGLASIAEFKVETTTGNIVLDKNNALTGLLSLKSPGNVTVKNSTGTMFGNVNADTLNVDSLGSIQGNGVVKVVGLATLGSGLDVTFENALNDFNSVSITNAQNVSLVDSNLLTLSALRAIGDIKTQSQGIILNGAVNSGSLSINGGGGRANIANTVSVQTNIDIAAQNIVVAGNLEAKANIKASTSGEFSQSANISGGNVELNAGRYIANSGSTAATNGSVVINSLSDLSTKNITATNDVILKTTNDLNVGGTVTTASGKIDLLAGRNITLNNDVNGQGGINLEATNGSLQQQALLASGNGDINLVTSGDLVMGSNSSTTATAGNISYAGKNLTVTALSAASGEVAFRASGAVIDGNAAANNITATRFIVNSMSGIGALDDIETTVGGLSLSNQLGDVRVVNTGAVVVDRLRTNGNVFFSNTGTITLDNRKNAYFNSAEPDALLAGGTVNSGYTIGNLSINIKSGDLVAESSTRLDIKNPDLTALNATVLIDGGEFGSITRPLSVYVKETFFLNATRSWNPFWGFDVRPQRVENLSTLQGSLSDFLSAGAEQLVEVEELNEINPAIFTNVRNYVYDDVAIMLPADQRYDDDSLSSAY
ncbi:MAG: filamentous hemagglutinin N-terminal domain-containing protein [Gammaproteobacteria bacterium]|nr:MAG: filamentous hemagglutinin N-terminal domain-containing protein [Gammaproteobacteria bacterium]